MTEYFDVDPGYVAGYGQLCGQVSGDTTNIARYLSGQASSAGFDGVVMAALAPIVDGYADAAAARVRGRSRVLAATDRELRNTAWSYLGADRPQRFVKVIDHISGNYTVEVNHPGLAGFDHESVWGDLVVPEVGDQDSRFEKLMEEHAGDTLGTIDLIIRTVTGLIPGVAEYSITQEISNQLTGDWMVLKQKADALDHAADASETAAGSLRSGLPRLDAHWDGGASASFAPYITTFATALAYEGPLNRVVAFGYRVVADLIEQLAGVVVELIGIGVNMVRKYATGIGGKVAGGLWGLVTEGKPPWEQAKEDWEEAKKFFDNAKTVVEEIHQLPEDLQALVDATKSPGAAADYSLDMAITELGEREDMPEGTAENLSLGYDFSRDVGPEIADLAGDADDFAHAPDQGFDAGVHPRRNG